jgi:hypothetical protein
VASSRAAKSGLPTIGEDAGSRLQVGEGLEQRDDIEYRGSAVGADRGPGETMHGGQVVGRLRERDDVASRRTGAVAFLDLRDRSNDLEGLLRDIAERLARVDLGEHRAVDGGMLAHLEFGEVKAEGLDLPDELLQLAVGMPTGAGAHQRLLHNR